MVPIPSVLVMPFAGYLARRVILTPRDPHHQQRRGAGRVGHLYWLVRRRQAALVKYGKFVGVRKDIEKTEEYFARHGKGTV